MKWLRFEAVEYKPRRRVFAVLIRADQVVSISEQMAGWCFIETTGGHRYLVHEGYGAVAQKLDVEVIA